MLSAARADEREEALELVVSQLKIRSFYSEVKVGGIRTAANFFQKSGIQALNGPM